MNCWILVLLLCCCSGNRSNGCSIDCNDRQDSGYNRERCCERRTSDCECDRDRGRDCKIEPRTFIPYQGSACGYEAEDRDCDCGCENNCR